MSATADFIGPYEAAQLLGCTRHKVLTLALLGEIEHTSIAGHVYFRRQSVEDAARRYAGKPLRNKPKAVSSPPR